MFKKNKKGDTNEESKNIIYSKNNEIIKLFTVEELKNKTIMNWNKNRMPDRIRIEQIKEYFKYNNIDLVPGIISVWEKDNQWIVYDGIHRLISSLENGNNDMKVIIRKITTQKEKEIIDDFLNINKSISVPSIYLENDNELKKLICQNVVEHLCSKYPNFVSPSRKPCIYNFNRDILIEFISDLNINFNKNGIDKLIINELSILNDTAKDFVKVNKINTPKKCKYYNFYLWYLDKSIIKQKIESAAMY